MTRTYTAAEIATMQNRAGKLSVTFLLQYLSAGWNDTGAITLDDVFEYSFDKDKCSIIFKNSASIGSILSYIDTQSARLRITETITDGATIPSANSPYYFIDRFQYLPESKAKLTGKVLPFQVTAVDPNQDVDTIIDALTSDRGINDTYITGQEWFDYEWGPAGPDVDIDLGELPRMLGKRYMVETFGKDNAILFRNRYNSPNLITDYTPFTTFIETFRHTAYNQPINGISWTDENGILHTSTGASKPIHHLGYVPSTATQSIMDLIDQVLMTTFKFKQWPDFRLENGDYIRVTVSGNTYAGLINCTHRLKRAKSGILTWEQEVETVQTPSVLGSTITANRLDASRLSPVNLELDTTFFEIILGHEDQSVQTAFDKLDRHTHGYSYMLQGQADAFSPADGLTYYIANTPVAPSTVDTDVRVYIPIAGTINWVRIFTNTVGGAAGTNQAISMYLRKNATTDSGLIETISVSSAIRIFDNDALAFAVAANDYISVKMVCPTWTTNPTLMKISWVVRVEVP